MSPASDSRMLADVGWPRISPDSRRVALGLWSLPRMRPGSGNRDRWRHIVGFVHAKTRMVTRPRATEALCVLAALAVAVGAGSARATSGAHHVASPMTVAGMRPVHEAHSHVENPSSQSSIASWVASQEYHAHRGGSRPAGPQQGPRLAYILLGYGYPTRNEDHGRFTSRDRLGRCRSPRQDAGRCIG